jgi:hypothetical protein
MEQGRLTFAADGAGVYLVQRAERIAAETRLLVTIYADPFTAGGVNER